MRRQTAERVAWVLRQVGVALLGVIVYFGVRGLNEGRPAEAERNAHEVLALERDLGLDHEHTMQAVIDGRDWLVTAANWVYIWGHWPVITAALIWLGLRHRPRFLLLRNAMMTSGAVGLVLFTLYPVAPPRLLDLGLVDTVSERSQAYRVLQPPAFVNQYAAMPSLHVGWNMLVGILVAGAATSAVVRWSARVMPLLMALAVVLTANHFIIDAVVGAALAYLGLLVARWWESRGEEPAPTIPPPRARADDGAGRPLRERRLSGR